MPNCNPTSRLLFSLGLVSCLAGIGTRSVAQVSASDTVLSNGLRIGFDVGRIANYFLQNRKNFGLEACADVGYQKWLGVVEAGYARNTDGRAGLYDHVSNGIYGRLGVERNMLRGGDDAVFWGLRYGVGRVAYRYDFYTVQDTVWGAATRSVPQSAGLMHWGEVVGGLKGKIWNNFYLGFTLRFRVRLADNIDSDTGPILMPGFGRASESTQFGVSYYVSYRIPFKKPATFVSKASLRKQVKKRQKAEEAKAVKRKK